MGDKRAAILIEYIERNDWREGAEVGVNCGATLFKLLNSCPLLKMWGVDSWCALDNEINTQRREYVLDGVEKYHSDRVVILHMDSVPAADEHISDESLDFVFIDGDHHTSQVKLDIAAWMPKIKQGGMMFGHDIQKGSVMAAVKSVFDDNYITREEGNMWIVNKGSIDA